MTALAVFLLLMLLFLTIASSSQRAWIEGEQKVEISQNGRAIIELMARELAPAVVSDTFQFVQSPALTTAMVPKLETNAPSLFWVAPNISSTKGDLCEIGYYLTRDAPNNSFCLNRLFIPPDSASYRATTTTPISYVGTATTADWITSLPQSTFDTSTVVSDGVVAMWIRCLDIAGNPIPWICTNSLYSSVSPGLQFNSAASFQMSGLSAPFADGSTFQYTAPPPTTIAAKRLPHSVEITVILVDSRTLKRNPVIPAMPALTTADDVPAQIEAFEQALIDAKVTSARTFTTRVRLLNATPY